MAYDTLAFGRADFGQRRTDSMRLVRKDLRPELLQDVRHLDPAAVLYPARRAGRILVFYSNIRESSAPPFV
jgi:hypothetical protein